MPGVTQLVEAAVERGEAYESVGVGKASNRDLTHYVLEIAEEVWKADPTECYSDSVIAAALFRIWTDES